MTNFLGNKLDEINKNIQIEKKKIRSNNLSNVNDLSLNYMNFTSNENKIDYNQKTNLVNQKIRGKSEINTNNILYNKKPIEGSSVNNNVSNLNDYKYTRTKR